MKEKLNHVCAFERGKQWLFHFCHLNSDQIYHTPPKHEMRNIHSKKEDD